MLGLEHHQLFSAYENGPEVGTVFRRKLRPVLHKGVHAWFWGHEHRFIIYDATKEVQNARLIGHGGVPVYMTRRENEPYPPPAMFEDRRFLQSGLARWALLGFAVLDLDGPIMNVSYVDEAGTSIRREVIR